MIHFINNENAKLFVHKSINNLVRVHLQQLQNFTNNN